MATVADLTVQPVIRWCHAGTIAHLRLPFNGNIHIPLTKLNRLRAEQVGLPPVTPEQITREGEGG